MKIMCLSKKYSAAVGGKSLLLALRAKFKFGTDVFFMILLRKIMKNTSVPKEYSAAEGGKNLFTQPQSNYLPGVSAASLRRIL